MANKANRLREQAREELASPEITVAPGVYDGISAKLVEDLGFAEGSITGAGVSNSRLGLPDMGFLNLSQNAQMCRAIANAVDIPIHADADTGYGNAVNVYETVKRLEATGVTSLMIEDQVWPKRCGHMEGKDTIGFDEMCAKIKAADDARNDTDPSLMIKARTDAAATNGIDEVIRRLKAFSKLGADIVFADALLEKEHVQRIASEVDAHYSVNMGYGIKQRPTTPLMSTAELAEWGVDLVTYPRLITGAAAQGMYNALEVLKESHEAGEVIERPELTFGWEDFMGLIDQPEFAEAENRYADVEIPTARAD